ncbi:MAG: thioesterase family protein, partial [Burkholderiaceae bacterium]
MTEADAGSNAANPSDASAWVAGREDSLEGAYFHTDDGHWFEPTAHCRGPWDVDGCHAGPPSGLLARSMERAIDASLRSAGNHQRLVRLTVDLIRPIPMAGFRVEAEVVRAGRSVSTLRAVIRDGDGRERVTATGLALRNDRNHPLPTIDERLYHPEEADPGGFPLTRAMHDQPGFVGSVALRYPPGETTAPGPTAVWMKTVPLI